MTANKMATANVEITARESTHARISGEIAAQGMVLLKNNGVLPFSSKIKMIALFGNGARRTVKGGTGSGDVNVRSFVSVEQGLQNIGYHVVTKPFLNEYDDMILQARQDHYDKFRPLAQQKGIKTALVTLMASPFQDPPFRALNREELSRYPADAAVYVLARNSGEGADRKNESGDYLLSEREINDITLLAKTYSQFVLLLNVGGIIGLQGIQNLSGIGAVMLVSQGGSSCGDAIASLLSGKVSPSGKLTATWAEHYADYPCAQEFLSSQNIDDAYYKEGIFVGYRYFDAADIKPAYSFGYGLSYTDFSISLQTASIKNNIVMLCVSVKNVGSKFSGKEVVQAYVSQPSGAIEKPIQVLAAFQKTPELAPFETQSINLSFPVTQLASFDESSCAWLLEKGEYIIRIGNSSNNTAPVAVLTLDYSVKTEQCMCIGAESLPSISFMKTRKDGSITHLPRLQINADIINTITHDYSDTFFHKQAEQNYIFSDVKTGKISPELFTASLSAEELIDLCVGAARTDLDNLSVIGNASKSIPGAAGETADTLTETRQIPYASMADGPAGIRISPKVYEREGLYISNPSEDPIMSKILPKEMQNADLSGTTIKYQYCTAIPIATLLAQTWDMALIQKAGDIVGIEMDELGMDLWLAPGMNIQRNPLCGRNFEYYSEDPFLTGKCAAAMTTGFQSHRGKGTTIKHFACNNQEMNRNYNNSHISQRALREIYLKGFEICVKASQPLAVMSSYNLINGTHAANLKELLTDVLRCEWGFDGIVMTDWYATQGKAATKDNYGRTDAIDCVKAGNDVIMPGSKQDAENLKAGYDTGLLTLDDLCRCAHRVIKLLMKIQS